MAETGTSAAPDPALVRVVTDPNDNDGPYSKTYVVAVPFGFTTPARLAPAAVIELAAPVTTVGAGGGPANSAKSACGTPLTVAKPPPA